MQDQEAGRIRYSSLRTLDHPSYQYLRNFCKDLQVVNDPAERAVKDVQDFAQMSRGPRDRDNVILVANGHFGRVARFRKGNLSSNEIGYQNSALDDMETAWKSY